MFLQQTMKPWFAVQRASQVLMILLAVTMLVMPLLVQPKEAEAIEPATATVIAAGIALVGVVVGAIISWWAKPDCPSCGDTVSKGEAHYTQCSKGHGIYSCDHAAVDEHQHDEESST